MARGAAPLPVLALERCVPRAIAAGIDAALARACSDRDRHFARPRVRGGCCGALRIHERRGARVGACQAQHRTHGGRPSISDVEALVVTASGCGCQVKDYGHCCATTPI